MTRARLLLTFAATVTAGLAFAHGGVQNPAVMARMEAMTSIGDGMKVLAGMVKGEIPYDATQADAARAAIKAQADRTPALFEAPEGDPKSEALPAIWENWADFEAKSQALGSAANGSVADPDALRQTLSALAGTCKACHRDYRQKQ